MNAIEWSILAGYFALCGVLSVYGLHRYYLVYLYYRHADRRARALPAPAEKPLVCVQLPIYNERYVVERLLTRVADLAWPKDRLHIQLLDDSTDDTSEIAARVIERLREKGAWIDHVCRPDRTGYKAGALQYGLARTEARYFAVFDADFLPSPDFLERTIPHFAAPEVGMVQVRWGHLNRDYSLLTRLESILLDGHFVIESAARQRAGRLLNFNGTAGVWRREAVEEAGGWEHDTLTEDLDLSYRAQMKGWRFVYMNDYLVPAEVPADMNAFKSQQHRWAKGSVQTARKLLGRILRSDLTLHQKAEAVFHLTGNASYPIMVALAVLMIPAVGARLRLEEVLTLREQMTLDAGLFLAATVSVTLFYLVSQREGYARWRDRLAYLPLALALGIGICVNQTKAVLEGLFGEVGEFKRTPKSGVAKRGDSASGQVYKILPSGVVLGELALGLAFTALAAKLVLSGVWATLPFVMLFQFGFLYVGLASLFPERFAPKAARA